MKRIIFTPGIFITILILPCCKPERIYINQKPTAVLMASTTVGDKPLKIEFDGSLSSDPENGILTYAWDFGNGTFSTSAYPSVTYGETGTFAVTLTVTDEEGLQDSDQTSIKVNEPPDLFPVTNQAQWVYSVKATETENGVVTGYDEGLTYLVVEKLDPEYTNIDVLDIRITGKRYYNKTLLVPGEYIYMMHSAGNFIKIAHEGSTYNAMVDLNNTTWSNYALFFSQASSQSVSLSTSSVTIGLGTYESYRISYQNDNWGENYVTERFDVSETEYINPGIGLVYRNTSRWVDFLDCFTCPVYGGSSKVELVGYYIKQADGTVKKAGYGYNPDNPYGGDLGMLTIWASENIGYTEVFLEGEYVGTITNYWSGGLDCGQKTALNVTYPDGTYTLTAESSKGYYWVGDITFIEGTCDYVELTLAKKQTATRRSIPVSR